MTFIQDKPEDFAAGALAGFCSLYRDRVRGVPGGAVRATATPRGKVALVIGGGSGHYPAFAGYIGPGLADGVVAGDIFASPSARSAMNVIRAAERGGGVLMGFGNYAGDVLHFTAAADRLAAEGVEVRILRVTDDIASASRDQSHLRRGVAGDVMVFKIAGAAAERGMTLNEVERLAQIANARTASFGVAFSGCTLPGAHAPLFTVPAGRMAIGLGIHGEPGIAEEAVLPAAELAKVLVGKLLEERPHDAGGRVAALLNGLGCTKYEELFVLWTSVENELRKAGLTLVAPEVGEYVTSLDMAGCSLTLTFLDHDLEDLWLAPADAPAFRRGVIIPVEPAPPLTNQARREAPIPPASAASRAAAQCLGALVARLAEAMRKAEKDLGRLDALAGDGDHGQAMSRGAAAAKEAADKAIAADAGAATTLALAGDAWADRAGGASGALWGALLRAWSGAFSDDRAIDLGEVVQGAKAARDVIVRLGGVKIGDKTLFDALDPFVAALASEAASGCTLEQAWRVAAAAAGRAADATASLTPKLGRARIHAARSLGHPDAGASSLALAAEVVSDLLNARKAED
jgi:dihydroxyacetone kinase